jgi:hypothetical protein
MRLFRGLALLTVLFIGPSVWAAEIARWEAGKGGQAGGTTLVNTEGSKWTLTQQHKFAVAAIEPTHDYYRRAEFIAKISKPTSFPVWLQLEYLDEGFGLISVGPAGRRGARYIPMTHQWGVARLNTGRLRRATFRIDGPPSRTPAGASSEGTLDFHINGVEYLHGIFLQDSEPAIEPVPDVKPAIQFQDAFQRDINIGADSPLGQEAEALAAIRNMAPLVRALGFNGVESYVQWNYVEHERGVYDWSHYDAIVNEIQKYGLKWFPLLIVGSAYSLPEWYHDSKENVPFECLEHHIPFDVQSTFCHFQDSHVQQFLSEFGKHYGESKALLGLRLGPSGNYGEAQYPATGNLGYRRGAVHTHIGYWAADPYASPAFQKWLEAKYHTIDQLNQVWEDHFTSFSQIQTFLPTSTPVPRKQLDFVNWYMGAMSDWCGQWAEWARADMPNASIYQSSGGWGPTQIGTDYTAHAKTMAQLHGGIRLTNESDNYPLNFAITRMASSAARFYGAQLGYEPGGFATMRGVVARIYNVITNGGDHLFYYSGNLFGNDQGTDAWRRYAPLINQRAKPTIDVAAFYPDTSIALNDEVIRYMFASAYLTRVEAMRSITDFDYASEQMILDGALDRYKVLICIWGAYTEKPVLERIDAWVKAGGTIIWISRPRGLLQTPEGDSSLAQSWQKGEVGKGRAIFYNGDPEPPDEYVEFVRQQLLGLKQLRPEVHTALQIDKPRDVYWSVLEGGKLALLNFTDHPALVRLPGGKTIPVQPYGIVMTTAWR